MNKDIIRDGLKAKSNSQDRVAAFYEIGIPHLRLMEVLDASNNSVRNWANGKHEPNLEAAKKIDDIRCALSALIIKGFDESESANWMQSRLDIPPYVRPIEMIGEKAVELFSIIDSTSPE